MKVLCALFLVTILFQAVYAASSEAIIGNGSIRVQALSSTVIRIENKGPMGFENRTTFNVVGRDHFSGIPLTVHNQTANSALLTTSAYQIQLNFNPPVSNWQCPGNVQTQTDVTYAQRTDAYPNGAYANDRNDCCNKCSGDSQCIAWVYAGNNAENDVNCWPLITFGDRAPGTADREFGCMNDECLSTITSITVSDLSGNQIWQQNGQPDPESKMLQFPSPSSSSSASGYMLTDFPRFYVPEWGPVPIPEGKTVDPALVQTNGYDFRNNKMGDHYIFLIGNTMEQYFHSRQDLVTLLGPTPLLPDYAYGTWFTWWHQYTESEAKSDIARWQSDKLPIDIWALDMNWRNTSNNQDHFYDHPNTSLFPNFTEWFEYLEAQKLKTYFNDHPFPVDYQTHAKEIDFRWNGLSEWMGRGLTFWWFDHNWKFSIPAPNMEPVGGWQLSLTDGNWVGLDNAAWGSHIYYESVSYFDANNRSGSERPMTLTKFGRPDWRAGYPSSGHAESPAQHRYPVWWTGDGVGLEGSLESMVDTGVHDFKPFVHSDCGGDYRPQNPGDLLRWTAHCAYGTILRFHGENHKPWSYDQHTEDVIRNYLNSRYKLIPSLISAGQTVSQTGFPYVARNDLFWPNYTEASGNHQYLFLNDTLVAPIWDSSTNVTCVPVWLPPGTWQDVWNGSSITGPQNINACQPYEQQPMWHKAGGMVVTTSSAETASLRVETQDWSDLALHIFPFPMKESIRAPQVVERSVYERQTGARTALKLSTTTTTDDANKLTQELVLDISESEDESISRGWMLRVQLQPEQRVVKAMAFDNEGRIMTECVSPVRHIFAVPNFEELEENPNAEYTPFVFPFGDPDSRPAPHAGPIAQLSLTSHHQARRLVLVIA